MKRKDKKEFEKKSKWRHILDGVVTTVRIKTLFDRLPKTKKKTKNKNKTKTKS